MGYKNGSHFLIVSLWKSFIHIGYQVFVIIPAMTNTDQPASLQPYLISCLSVVMLATLPSNIL